MNIKTELVFQDNFDNGLDNWIQNDFTENPNHRTGYKNLRLDGSFDEDMKGIKVPGRWASLMHKHRDKVQFIRDGVLVLKGFAVNEPNKYRKNFTGPDGRLMPYGDWQLFTAWLELKMPLEVGHVIETVFNVENQCMGGNRFSSWGVAKKPYITIDATEMDSIEVENPERHHPDTGHMVNAKIVGGENVGDTPNGTIDVRTHGINIREGWHKSTLIRHLDGSTSFLLDGIKINHDPRSSTAPVDWILSCEQNSGCKTSGAAAHELDADGPYQPHDPGLTARSVIDDLHMIDRHEVLVKSVSVYKIIESAN